MSTSSGLDCTAAGHCIVTESSTPRRSEWAQDFWPILELPRRESSSDSDCLTSDYLGAVTGPAPRLANPRLANPRLANPRIAIVGPTATGKTAKAIELALELDGEVISGDSMCVYRQMDIGTAKPTVEERSGVPHHLIDVADADEEFSLATFADLARKAIADIEGRGKRVILAGGTGLYVDTIIGDLTLPGQYPEARAELDAEPDDEATTIALHSRLTQLDPLAASRMESTNRRRIIRALEVTIGSGKPFSSFGPGLEAAQQAATGWSLIGLDASRDELALRIAARYERQMADGFLEEVVSLQQQYGMTLSRTATQGLGYRQLLAHLEGTCTLEAALEEARVATVKFAKRQQRWFRRNPSIQWESVTSDGSSTDSSTDND